VPSERVRLVLVVVVVVVVGDPRHSLTSKASLVTLA
jgi:hypothetical protein